MSKEFLAARFIVGEEIIIMSCMVKINEMQDERKEQIEILRFTSNFWHLNSHFIFIHFFYHYKWQFVYKSAFKNWVVVKQFKIFKYRHSILCHTDNKVYLLIIKTNMHTKTSIIRDFLDCWLTELDCKIQIQNNWHSPT